MTTAVPSTCCEVLFKFVKKQQRGWNNVVKRSKERYDRPFDESTYIREPERALIGLRIWNMNGIECEGFQELP